MIGCLLHAPCWGTGPKPSHVPWLGIKLGTLCLTDLHSIHWTTPARAVEIVLNLKKLIYIIKLFWSPNYLTLLNQFYQWFKSISSLITFKWDSMFSSLSMNIISFSSGQDGGIGRNLSLPSTTKRKITTNLKTINNHRCQKIKLHGTQIMT